MSLALLFIWTTPTHAAEPGEELASSSGALNASQTVTIPLYSPDAANIRLQVGGGGPTDTITMALRNGTTVVTSWVVRSGETTWGYATLPSGGNITLQNNSGTQPAPALRVYARGVTPNITESGATWSGVARGGGIKSAIQLSVPTAGRYRLTFGASGGSFQLKVDTNAYPQDRRSGQPAQPHRQRLLPERRHPYLHDRPEHRRHADHLERHAGHRRQPRHAAQQREQRRAGRRLP